jgi:sugar lactone lactonase YvrE/predicted Ser/Thr protein kinase
MRWGDVSGNTCVYPAARKELVQPMDVLQPGDPAAVGGYRLLGRLGSGGMGQVYLGTSPSGRKVAVKLIKPEYARTPHFRERFTREVEAARRVGGFHTAAVVDADPDADPPWMITAYIQGQSLHEAVNAGGPLGQDALRAFGAGLAEGLSAIHACGLVHRDLKPANVIMAEDGPRIIDFGIARVTDVSALTTTGSVVGTVTFMSPEQVRGETIGPASDVFSLGCVLAFAATGRVPFDGETIVTVMHKIMYEPPDLDGIPGDGEFGALLTRCLAKGPEDRPPLRELLIRFTGEPEMHVGVPAVTSRDVTRPAALSRHRAPTQDGPLTAEAAPGTTEQVARRFRSPRRRRLAVTALAALVAAALAASLPVLLSGRHITRGNTPATANGGGTSGGLAGRAPQAEPQPEFELADPSGGRLINVAFQPHGSLLAGADGDGRTYLWDATSGHLTATLDDPGGKAVPGVAFTPSGTEIVTGDLNGSAYLWRLNGGAPVVTYSAAGSHGMTDVGIFGNGRLLAAGDANGTVHYWDVATGKFFMSPAEPGGRPVLAVAFSPVAAILASTDLSHTVYLWKLSSTARLYATLPDTSASPADPGHGGVAFSPDGTWLATADRYNTYVWDVSGRTRLRVLPDSARGCAHCVLNVAFSPDGRLLATSMTSGAQAGSPLVGRIYLWDTTTWTLLRTWPEPASVVNGYIAPGIAFSSDGTQLATADGSGKAYVWKLTDIIAADKL